MGIHTALSESSAFRKPTKQNVRIAKAKTRIQMDSVVRASAFRMKKKKKKKTVGPTLSESDRRIV